MGLREKGGDLGKEKKKTLASVEEASDKVRLVEHKLLTSETKRLVIFLRNVTIIIADLLR